MISQLTNRRNLTAASLFATLFLWLAMGPLSALAGNWTSFAVLKNSSVDVVKSSTGDVYRASVGETYSGKTVYSFGRCLNDSCSFIAYGMDLNEADGTIYQYDGSILPGVKFQITRDPDTREVLGGQGGVDNISFKLK